MSLDLWGIGTATPSCAVTQPRAIKLVNELVPGTSRQRQVLSTVYTQAGVRTRHSILAQIGPSGLVEQSFYSPAANGSDAGPTTAERMKQYEAHAARLAEQASRQALSRAGVEARDITHVVTVSCSGFRAPGFDVALFDLLGLSPEAPRTHVGFMGCHGLLNGLRVARAFAESDPRARVLVCAVELCSLHHQYGWGRDQLVANALFADGAAAAVAGAGPREGGLSLMAQGATIVPGTADLMTWSIGNHGFQMTLSPRVPEIIEAQLRPWLERWLERQGLALTEVGGWAVHPGGPRILQACQTSLELSEQALAESWGVLADCGNMSSPTVLFIVQRLREKDVPRPWLLLGFGPGLTIEAALLK